MASVADNRRVLLDPEERLRLIEENVRDHALFTMDTVGVVTSWNSGAEQLLGYSESEIVGRPGALIFTPEDIDRQAPEAEMKTARVKGRAVDERWHLRKNGSRLWGVGIMTALREPDGELRGYAKILRDFTDRKMAEDARRDLESRLFAAEAQFRMLVENVREYAIFLVDPRGRISTWNEGAERIHGYIASEVIGQHISILCSEEDTAAQRSEEILKKARDRGQYQEVRSRRRKDGSHFPAGLAVDVVYDPKGELLGYPHVIQDLTERTQLEEALKAEIERCEGVAREVQELNDRLSRAMVETHHRVKNNLQLMSAMVDMQISRDIEPTVQDLRHLSAQIRALAAVHGVLTDVAKDETGEGMVRAPVILDRLLENVRMTVPYRQIRARVDDIRLPMKQGTTLALLVNELVSNAIKHGRGDIEVSLSTPNGFAVLEVCDDGPGFPPDFDPRAASGTGFELVDIMVRWDLQGTIEFGATAQGARVTVRFPMAAMPQTVPQTVPQKIHGKSG